ncbi:hypothetical protein PQI66_09970 [Corynebacterium sp. USCH3]|uniref:hypothetical protein n=1 Tax=Corynebacterium sp. USCH3 TaxID=3024840 RepID=UPI0030999567
MTDQPTPVTDDDRLAHEWADMAENYPDEATTWKATARAIRAHVPAPPATLADELRETAGMMNYAATRAPEIRDRINKHADRVEAVEKENRDNVHRIIEWMGTAGTLRAEVELLKEQDEARKDELHKYREIRKNQRAELARLNTEVERLTEERLDRNPETKARVERAIANLDQAETVEVDVPPGMYELDRGLPDPADVPDGEPWEVIGPEGRAIGFRDGLPGGEWAIAYPGGHGSDDVGDQAVTLVSRLLPETRRVIDRPEALDALPVRSVVVSQYGRGWVKTLNGGWTLSGTPVTSKDVIDTLGPVTVIHEGVTA